MKKVAISACLLGCSCRYDARDNFNKTLLELLKDTELIPFCPEDACFGTPRPTMDLLKTKEGVVALSNETEKNISIPLIRYAEDFFYNNPDIELFIGKDRSPSCAVESGRVYDEQKNLLHEEGTGIMAKVALEFGIECWDAEVYVATHTS